MTVQINDKFRHSGTDYSLISIGKGELFDPDSLGIHTGMGRCSACWRGYQVVYSVIDDRLVVADLYYYAGFDHKGGQVTPTQGPKVNDVTPSVSDDFHSGLNNFYASINHRLNYTGGLLLGSDFITDLRSGGYLQAWKYNTTVELTFENGILSDICDRSHDMSIIRETILEPGNKDRSTRNKIIDHVHKTRRMKELLRLTFDGLYAGDIWPQDDLYDQDMMDYVELIK